MDVEIQWVESLPELQNQDLSKLKVLVIIGFGSPEKIDNIDGLNTENPDLNLRMKEGSTILLSASHTGAMESKSNFQHSILDGIGENPSEGLPKSLAYALAINNPGVNITAPCVHISGVVYDKEPSKTIGARFYNFSTESPEQIIHTVNYVKLRCTDPKKLEVDIKLRYIEPKLRAPKGGKGYLQLMKRGRKIYIYDNATKFNVKSPYQEQIR
jgi:hypothetical protein